MAQQLIILWFLFVHGRNRNLYSVHKGQLCFLSSCRLVELLPSVHIPRYWGIATKCLSYAKTSTDPFVYCLLRQQYRKVLVSIISRVLRKDQYLLSVYSTSSTLDTTDDNCVARITWAECANISMIQHLLKDQRGNPADGEKSVFCWRISTTWTTGLLK